MTLKELKLLCIKYTTMDSEVGLTTETYDDYVNDATYKDLFNNVLNSINRAVGRIVDSEKLKEKTIVLQPLNDSKVFATYDLSLNADYGKIYRIKKVIWNTANGDYIEAEYKYFNGKLILPQITEGEFWVIYSPRIDPLTDSNDDNNLATLCGLTTEFCNVIQYFAKAELWEVEEPELAQNYRNYAETYLAEIRTQNLDFTQKKVKSVYTY